MPLADGKGFTYGNNQHMVCLDSCGMHDFAGRFYEGGSGKQINFRDVEELIFSIEKILDEQNFPQACNTYRTFSSGNEEKSKNKVILNEEKVIEEIPKKKEPGNKATFIVQVQFRRNATWQGTIKWIEKGESEYFRSVLEMIKLMDSARLSDEDIEEMSWNTDK